MAIVANTNTENTSTYVKSPGASSSNLQQKENEEKSVKNCEELSPKTIEVLSQGLGRHGGILPNLPAKGREGVQNYGCNLLLKLKSESYPLHLGLNVGRFRPMCIQSVRNKFSR